jgi:polar amino acid transport system substrate-binding protein
LLSNILTWIGLLENNMKPLNLLSAFAVAGVLTAGTTFSPSPTMAQSIKCGEPYKIVRGDSLNQIAWRAYAGAVSFQFIYSANSGSIGADPSFIQEGATLSIPCLDDVTPSTANTSVLRTASTTKALPPPKPRQIRFVVGSDWAPFTNEDQAQGGMMTEVTNVAMSLADGKPSYKIDFINDWGAHLQPLITDHAYDFSLVWFRPNCALVDKLGDGSKFRCNNLDWSQPMFEQVIGYYTRVDQPRPATHSDLFGRHICRPSGYSTFMMEEVDLVEPNIKFTREGMTTGCFEGLVSGKYDAVVLAADVAEGAIAKIGAKDKVKFQDHLSQVATMHAVIAKTNPRAKEYLATLDSGITKLKESGEWFRIITRQMAEHRANTK